MGASESTFAPKPSTNNWSRDKLAKNVFLRSANQGNRILSSTELSELSLSTRLSNLVQKFNIKTVKDLLVSLQALSASRGFGSACQKEIDELLSKNASSNMHIDSDYQLLALMASSHSDTYVFDQLGRLRMRPFVLDVNPAPADSDSNSVLDEGVEVLCLPDPIYRRIKAAGIDTVRDLAQRTKDELLNWRGVGEKKISEIDRALEQFGLSLGNASNPTRKHRAQIKLDDYYKSFSSEAFAVIEAAIAMLGNYDSVLNKESFTIIYLSEAEELHKRHSLADASKMIARIFLDSDDLREYRIDYIRQQIAQSLLTLSSSCVSPTINIPKDELWIQAAAYSLQSFPACILGASGKIIVKGVPLSEWISSLDDSRESNIIRMRIDGLTLQEAGKRIGITRERVRQLETRVIRNRPIIEEDRFTYLYKTYRMDSRLFSECTGYSEGAFRYLSMVCKEKKGSQKLSECFNDPLLPNSLKARIEDVLGLSKLIVDGQSIERKRRPLLEAIVKEHASHDSISTEQVNDYYEQYVKAHSLSRKEFRKFSSRSLNAFLDRSNCILCVPRPKGEGPVKEGIRYYEYGDGDFCQLKEFLLCGRYHDVEISTALIVKDPKARPILNKYDIRDEYELHYVIRKYCGLVPGVELGRSPTIVFGAGNRQLQILNLIKQRSPIDAASLARAYEDEYGFSQGTVLGNFLKEFETYQRNGTYYYSQGCLNAEQEVWLRELLCRPYHPIASVRAAFLSRFPNVSLSILNDDNLADIGYRISGSLLFRTDVDESSLFGDIIKDNELFGLRTLGSSVISNPVFKAELNKGLRALEVVEYDKNEFARTEALSCEGRMLTAADLEDYIESVLAYIEPDTPYTIRKLRRMGFKHKLDNAEAEVEIGEHFYGELVGMAYVGGRIKKTSINDTLIFAKKPGALVAPDLIEHILSQESYYSTPSLCDYLLEEYGVIISPSQLRSLAVRSACVLDREIDVIFFSEEARENCRQNIYQV